MEYEVRNNWLGSHTGDTFSDSQLDYYYNLKDIVTTAIESGKETTMRQDLAARLAEKYGHPEDTAAFLPMVDCVLEGIKEL